MNVLITGGGGFIGRALIRQCLDRRWTVSICDNFQVGRRENLAAYEAQLSVYQADIRDEEALAQVFAAVRPQLVFHLAALHYIPYCNSHPQETMEVNVTGTYGVLAQCRQHGVAQVVFASSGALYPSADIALSEEGMAPAPVDVYGLSKLLGEQICRYFCSAAGGLRGVIARLFNTYGPYETNAHLLPEIMAQLKQGDQLALGNLEPKRDYIFVEDTAAALARLGEVPRADCPTVNVGTGVEYSVREIVEQLIRLTGRPLTITQQAARTRPVDKLHQIAATGKLQQLTGFTARYDLASGLRALLRHEGFAVGVG